MHGEPAEHLCLAAETRQLGCPQVFGLDDRESDVGIEAGVAREVDGLSRALTEQTLHSVATSPKRA
jgi:hypothetical protein